MIKYYFNMLDILNSSNWSNSYLDLYARIDHWRRKV